MLFHQAQADACSWEQKLQLAEQNYMAENVKIRTDLTTRLERITKQYEAANKDKEAMVIKYATSEREVRRQLKNAWLNLQHVHLIIRVSFTV